MSNQQSETFINTFCQLIDTKDQLPFAQSPWVVAPDGITFALEGLDTGGLMIWTTGAPPRAVLTHKDHPAPGPEWMGHPLPETLLAGVVPHARTTIQIAIKLDPYEGFTLSAVSARRLYRVDWRFRKMQGRWWCINPVTKTATCYAPARIAPIRTLRGAQAL